MEVEEPYCYEWDSKLKLSDVGFEHRLNGNDYDEDAAKEIAFPSDYTLAMFAESAYHDSDYLLPDNWELLTTATNTSKTNGYFGVAFWNPKLCQVVIAHRGTKLTNLGAVISDVQLAVNSEKTRQSQSAATFVYLVSEQIKMKNSGNGPLLHLSITGHSLGAWLAQLTTFTAKYFIKSETKFTEDKNYLQNSHVHTVVFESPGCKEALTKLVKVFIPRYAHRKYGNYDTLDMTVYLSKLNPINSINQHVGIIYMVQSKTHSIKEIVNLFDPKTHKIQREIMLDFRSGIYASCKSLIKKLLPFTSAEKHIVKQPANDDEYSLNVFTEDELDFVKDWIHVVKRGSPNVEEFRTKNSVLEFEVDYEYNTVKSDNLNKVVACIKRLRPTKTVILELLKKDVHDGAYSVMFKLETEHFQRNLLVFKNYYFQDKYNLLKFLESKTHVLHIRVDKDSTMEFELETTILNNVLTFYQKKARIENILVNDYLKQNQCCFLNWSKLQKMQHFLPKILGKGSNKVNLLVLECFEAFEDDEESILCFLRQCTAKVVVISTDEFSWAEENGIKEISGFGSNIKFQDLTEESQKEFMMQQHLMLNGKKLSLGDIINAKFPLNNKIYKHLNQAIPVCALLEVMLTPLTNPIVMDCPHNNLLTSVVFLDLYSETNLTEILTKSCEELTFIIQDKERYGLSENDKSILTETTPNIKIQCDANFEKECLENFNSQPITFCFTAENGSLHLSKIFNKNFYIPRNIICTTTVSSLVFDNLNEDIDQYYFCGNKDKFKEMISYLDSEQRGHFNFKSSLEVARDCVKNFKSNAHLLTIDEEKIMWLYSHGNMETLRPYMQENKFSIKETKLIDIQEIVILAGEPGMGKSSTIGYLFLQLKQTHWVFALSLKHSVFDDLREEITFESAAGFILKSCGISDTNCLQYLLSYCLENESNLPIYLMFDAYDEIYKRECRQKFISLINFLKYYSKAKILITTRKYRCKELENGISVFSFHYEEFNQTTDVLDFFDHFQNSLLFFTSDKINTNRIRNLIPNILESAENIFGETISTFISMPMQVRMLAEVLTPLSASSASLIALEDILGLYQKYINIYYDIYFKKAGLPHNETLHKWLTEIISAKLYKLAVMKIFNLGRKDMDFIDIEELNKVGLIQSDLYNNFEYEFLHDSVRDYFIAYLLKLWLESHVELYSSDWYIEKCIVSDFLLNGKFKEVRLFLNCYLKNVTISNDRLKMCQDMLEQLLKSNEKLLFSDTDQESFFHVCVKEGLYFLTKHFLFQIVNKTNRTKLLAKRNSELETPVFLAIVKADQNQHKTQNILTLILEELNEWSSDDIKTVLLATLFTYFVSSDHLNTLNKYLVDYPKVSKVTEVVSQQSNQTDDFLDACKFNDIKKVNKLLEKFQNDKITRDYLLLKTNERKETCLHLTSSIEIADKLLQLGANKNLRDHHGMTPLTRAIKRGLTDIALKLINKGALFIADYVNNSPLLHAAKYNNFEVVKLLFSSKNMSKTSIDCRNVFDVTPLMIAAKNGNELIVKFLLDKGANINAADWNGMTPIYHAVKGNHTKLISIFRKKEANINIQDQNGITPLLYAITKRRWDMVNSILDNGADINIRSSKNVFPLKVLIEMDKKLIIKKVLEKEVKKTADGFIIREAARTDILSKEEKAYIDAL